MVCNYPNQSKSISNVPETCAEVTAGGRRGQTKQNKQHRKSPAVHKILSGLLEVAVAADAGKEREGYAFTLPIDGKNTVRLFSSELEFICTLCYYFLFSL